jgi:hypothetical protein
MRATSQALLRGIRLKVLPRRQTSPNPVPFADPLRENRRFDLSTIAQVRPQTTENQKLLRLCWLFKIQLGRARSPTCPNSSHRLARRKIVVV